MAARLGHVDVDRHLAQPAFNHQGIEKFRMFKQGLSMGHEHRHHSGRDRVSHDLNQFVGASGAPVGIGDVAAGNLQTGARSLETAVGRDLFLHQCK